MSALGSFFVRWLDSHILILCRHRPRLRMKNKIHKILEWKKWCLFEDVMIENCLALIASWLLETLLPLDRVRTIRQCPVLFKSNWGLYWLADDSEFVKHAAQHFSLFNKVFSGKTSITIMVIFKLVLWFRHSWIPLYWLSQKPTSELKRKTTKKRAALCFLMIFKILLA